MVDSAAALARAIEAGRPAVTEDPMLVATSPHVDIVLEVTGAVEEAIAPVVAAIEHGKHVPLMNPELDGTLGPLLKHKADKAGVVFTDVDGDQPGVEGNLWRFVKGLGRAAGALRQHQGPAGPLPHADDPEGLRREVGAEAAMVTSFADGTKVSFEQAVVANTTGMTVAKRGMHGYTVEPGTPIMEAAKLWDPDELLAGPGIVDYVVGAAPGPGVFVLGTIEHPRQRHYLNLYKLGEGPIYCFHTPYHLCHFEVPATLARAALFHDATIAPLGRAVRRGGGGGQARPQGGRGRSTSSAVISSTARPRRRRDARDGHLPIGVAVGASSGGTSPRTRCSPTPTSSSGRAARRPLPRRAGRALRHRARDRGGGRIILRDRPPWLHRRADSPLAARWNRPVMNMMPIIRSGHAHVVALAESQVAPSTSSRSGRIGRALR